MCRYLDSLGLIQCHKQFRNTCCHCRSSLKRGHVLHTHAIGKRSWCSRYHLKCILHKPHRGRPRLSLTWSLFRSELRFSSRILQSDQGISYQVDRTLCIPVWLSQGFLSTKCINTRIFGLSPLWGSKYQWCRLHKLQFSQHRLGLLCSLSMMYPKLFCRKGHDGMCLLQRLCRMR